MVKIIIFILLALACAPGKTVKLTGPAIALSADSWSFGTLKRGERRAGEIIVTNTGTDTLEISLYSTCGCLEAAVDADRLAPGEGLPIHLVYLGDEIKEKATKTIYVDSNDEKSPRLTVEVTGKVIAGDGPHLRVTPDPLLFDPEDPLYPTAFLAIHNIGGQHLEIIDIRCFGCTAEWEPTRLSESVEYGLYIMKIEDWAGIQWIEIDTNDPVYPLKRVVIFEL